MFHSSIHWSTSCTFPASRCITWPWSRDFTAETLMIYGIFMAYLWHIYGICMAYLWHIYGIFMAYLWHIYGIFMAYVWLPTEENSWFYCYSSKITTWKPLVVVLWKIVVLLDIFFCKNGCVPILNPCYQYLRPYPVEKSRRPRQLRFIWQKWLGIIGKCGTWRHVSH